MEKSMLDTVLCALRDINDHYGNLLLLVVAVGTLVYAYREYSLKRRPVVVPEIRWETKDDIWYFSLSLANLGMTPAHAQIDTALLRIGDETHPTIFRSPIILPGSGSPTSKQVLAPIGSINPIGRRRIKGHEYRENRCEAHIEIKSKAIGEKEFRYRSSFTYQIDVSGESPVFILVKEEIH
jgi:hypothetical protein